MYGGGYPAPGQAYPGAPAPTQNPEVIQWFRNVDKDNTGKIDWQELQTALINGEGNHFSDTACRLMIGMFDKDRSGTIDLSEFEQLFNYINQWLAVFRNYDRDQSGFIDVTELQQALQQMGFRFSPEFVKFLIEKSDPKTHTKMSVDNFIVVCIQIQRFTEAFRAKDKEMSGTITIGFEDFLTVAINCSS